jgi:hypothetical protein
VEGPGASLLEGPNPSAAHHCSGARHLNYAIIKSPERDELWPALITSRPRTALRSPLLTAGRFSRTARLHRQRLPFSVARARARVMGS